MWLNTLRKWVEGTKLQRGGKNNRRKQKANQFRPGMECLEERTLLSTLIGITDPGISTMVPTPGSVFSIDSQTGSETTIFTGASGTLEGPSPKGSVIFAA